MLFLRLWKKGNVRAHSLALCLQRHNSTYSYAFISLISKFPDRVLGFQLRNYNMYNCNTYYLQYINPIVIKQQQWDKHVLLNSIKKHQRPTLITLHFINSSILFNENNDNVLVTSRIMSMGKSKEKFRKAINCYGLITVIVSRLLHHVCYF